MTHIPFVRKGFFTKFLSTVNKELWKKSALCPKRCHKQSPRIEQEFLNSLSAKNAKKRREFQEYFTVAKRSLVLTRGRTQKKTQKMGTLFISHFKIYRFYLTI